MTLLMCIFIRTTHIDMHKFILFMCILYTTLLHTTHTFFITHSYNAIHYIFIHYYTIIYYTLYRGRVPENMRQSLPRGADPAGGRV